MLHLLRKKFLIDWRQQECIERKRKANSSSMRVFAFEDPKFRSGCRKFIAVELRDFYLWYKTDCPKGQRHFYELILENVPCRLYFDLEFLYELNEGVDAMAMLDDFIRVTCTSISQLLNIDLCPEKDFLIFDSSSSTKFSAHVIVHIPNSKCPLKVSSSSIAEVNEMVFPDNVSLKPIVMYICSNLLGSGKCLVTQNAKGGKMTFLCDLSVYSRNRNFRLYLSSKCGKTETLELAEYCSFYKTRSFDSPKNAQIFLDSLVIPYNFEKLPVINLDSLTGLRNLKSLINQGMDQQQQRYSLQTNNNSKTGIGIATPSITWDANCEDHRDTPTKLDQLACGTPSSPFPLLDQHMLKIFHGFNPDANIRTWQLIRMRGNAQERGNGGRSVFHLEYQLNNSRYCMNRGREHKSQNVYWLVDFTSFHFVQRCFDRVDCPNYISPAFAFPSEICEYLHRQIKIVLKKYDVSEEEYALPDLIALRLKRYQAESDSFNKTAEWREKYGTNISFLQLYTPMKR